MSGNFKGEIISSFKNRPEGVRVKHWVRGNSVKMYDKAGSVLRVETTIGQPRDFKAFRPSQNDPDGKLKWQPLRKGIADLNRLAEVSQKSDDAYLRALSVVDDSSPCAKVFDSVSRPVIEKGKRTRALRLGDRNDIALLEAVCRGEFAASGFRNRDITRLLHASAPSAPKREQRRLSSRTSRLFRILRAHGLMRKIPKTHRYRLTPMGELLTTAITATRTATIKQLLAIAA